MVPLTYSQILYFISAEATKAPYNPRRKGPNPLESFLKADD